MIIIFFLLLLLFTIYSYALVDPNLTLMSHPIWVSWRETSVQLGYYHRDISWYLFLGLLTGLFLTYLLILKKSKFQSPFKLSLVVGVIVLFAYPFLSHDFFNYIFDAKILTFYGQNPYTHKPSDFGADSWLRFMHWTHRSYPYGPFFLVMTIVPSFMSLGKFVLNFFLFKGLFIGMYILSVWILQKMDKRNSLIFALHPFIIVEGLINTHNDLLAVSLALIGTYYLMKEKKVFSIVFFVLSAAIKYTTFPLISLQKEKKHPFNIGALIMQTAVIGYLVLFREIQPWYFLTFFAFLPLYPRLITAFSIFFFGLLLSYFPFIRLGEWTTYGLLLKHVIIGTSLVLNLIYLSWTERHYLISLFGREFKLLRR